MLKILQAKLQQCMNWELPDVQAGFRKGRGNQRSNSQHSLDHREIEGIPEKTPTSASLTRLRPLPNFGKFFKRWEYQTTLLVSWETCIAGQEVTELDMEQHTRSKLGKEYIKPVYCHLAYLTYAEYTIWNARLDKSQAEIKIARRNINNLRYAYVTTLMAESKEELKSI